jgi:hypothetical protein
MADPQLSKGKKLLFGVVTVVGIPLLALVALEGLSSLVLLGRDLTQARGLAERFHTEYDSLLGWIHLPDVEIQDIYGPGRHLRTNAQRFRAEEPTTVEKPPGRYRILCAGDSFTLGFGVSDDATWCHLLQEDREEIQTVNLGQAGYGLDQAYLWYLRDGHPITHDALVFSFITDDFRRISLTSFEGYPKPRLRVREGGLVVENVPVPRPFWRGWRARFGPAFRGLRASDLLRRGLLVLGRSPSIPTDESIREREVISHYIFRELASLGEREGRLVILVHLPSRYDDRSDHSAPWRQHVAASASGLGLTFFDLVEKIRQLPPLQVESLYRNGHLNDAGNEWVASTLLDLLGTLPEFEEGITSLTSRSEPAAPGPR